MGGLNFKEGIIHYYLFQKKLSRYFQKKPHSKDGDKFKIAYYIHPDWIIYWRKSINYKKIKQYFDIIQLNKQNLELNEHNIDSYMKKHNIEGEIENIINLVKTNYFDITHENIFDRHILINLITEDIYKGLKINHKTTKIQMRYIMKKQMLIIVMDDNMMIKIIIPDISIYNNNTNIVHLSWKFYNKKIYYDKLVFLEKTDSKNLMEYFLTKEIFGKPTYIYYNKNNELIYYLINEELNYNAKYGNELLHHNNNTINKQIIKRPEEINYGLTKRINIRGLDNVGATCYMNATLQCMANIKPITDYLLNSNKYFDIFNNKSLCPLTIEYCQVLLGLFCDKSNIGSYSPKPFKNIIGEMNPLFQGVQANDSKDLIIFLLEVLNSELSKLHNKKYNNTKRVDNEQSQKVDPSNIKEVLKEFLKDFKMNHPTIIGENLYGFQKNIFICQQCFGISNNFNIFNFLIFGLENTANFFQLNNFNNNIPVLTFDHCFKYLLKEELFQDTYCQKCKKTGNSIYKENIYVMPNYLIIILNRGKGNIFNCKVEIPEEFDSSFYEEKVKNKKYELIGIVSHFGESGMGGHFIAFCKHNLDNKWRCYNDSIVTDCQNDYLNKGTPYILFYKILDMSMNNNNSNNSNIPLNFPQNNISFGVIQQNPINNNGCFNQNINFRNNNFQSGFNKNNFQGNINSNINQNMNINNMQNNMNIFNSCNMFNNNNF